MKRLIAKEWESYRDAVIPAGAGATQREETRRAFYAGAGSLLHRLQSLMGPGLEPTDADLEVMREVHNELREYIEELRRATS